MLQLESKVFPVNDVGFHKVTRFVSVFLGTGSFVCESWKNRIKKKPQQNTKQNFHLPSICG
jgi:hypothetical protein